MSLIGCLSLVFIPLKCGRVYRHCAELRNVEAGISVMNNNHSRCHHNKKSGKTRTRKTCFSTVKAVYSNPQPPLRQMESSSYSEVLAGPL